MLMCAIDYFYLYVILTYALDDFTIELISIIVDVEYQCVIYI